MNMKYSGYNQTIREQLALTGNIGIDARHIEAYMRLEHSTLDGLNKHQFNTEVEIGVECVKVSGNENAEKLALSFGL